MTSSVAAALAVWLLWLTNRPRMVAQQAWTLRSSSAICIRAHQGLASRQGLADLPCIAILQQLCYERNRALVVEGVQVLCAQTCREFVP